MTLLFMDGFDHYAESGEQPLDKGYITGNFAYYDFVTGRFNYGYAIQFKDSMGYGYFRKNLGVSKSTIYFGAAVKKFPGTPTHSADDPFIHFKDESSVVQVRLHVLADFSIAAYQGDGTLLGTSAAGVFLDQYWQYLEVKITISATVGEVTIRINETQILNLTSQDTKNGSDYIRWFDMTHINGQHCSWDDLYVDDAQFHGDCRIRTFVPDSISSTNNDFTASAGNKDECVDDIPSNEDTDYIVSDTLNHKQTFGITTGALGTVKGIQLNNHCRVDAGGSRKITPLIRSNGTNYSGTEVANNVPDTYKFESEVWETDPDDSNVWTQTKLEAAEFGLEITT